MRAAAALLALALAGAPQDGDERTFEVPAGRETPARPEILLRTPDELPRAEGSAWEAFADVDRRQEFLRSLGPEVVEPMARAEADYVAGRFPQALAELYAVLTDHADFPPALMLLGTAYFRLRRYDDARVAFERFLEVSPDDVWRTQGLGHAYYSLGRYEEARAHYERVLADAPEEVGTSPEAVRGLALCHMRLGDAERALELLDRVIELRPDHAEAHTFRARILYDEGRLEEALAAAERARELAPYKPQGWYFAMRILFDLGREEEAFEAEERWRELDRAAQEIRSLEMLLKFRPGDFAVLMELCRLHTEIGDVETVRTRLADLLAARPEEVPEVEVRILVLDVLSELGDAEGARVAAKALEESCPDSYEAWKRLELYYASVRDRVNQVRCAAEAARLEAAR